MEKRFALSLLISLVLIFWYIQTYDPKPSFLLIANYIEASTLTKISLLFNLIGIEKLALPSILLIPFLKTPNSTFLLFGLNILLIFSSAYLLWEKTRAPAYLFPLIIFAPTATSAISITLEASMLLFTFCLFIYTNKDIVRILAGFIGILTSFAAWPIFLILFIGNFIKTRKLINLVSLMSVSVVVFLILNTHPDIISQYFPTTLSRTHGFYTDIHRQADLVGEAPLLGKLFYNKYIVIPRMIFNQGAKYLDWDYLVFHTATGKYTAEPPTFALFSVFELPIIISSLYFLIRGRISGKLAVVAILFSLSIYSNDTILIPTYYFVLTYLFLQTWNKLKFLQHKSLIIFILPLIFWGRIVLINHKEVELSKFGSAYKVYEEVVPYLARSDKEILFTDRIGQPHIYLAYLKAIDTKSIASALADTKRRDGLSFKQPDAINNINFASFIYKPNSVDSENYNNKILVEFEENIETATKCESKCRKLNETIKLRGMDKPSSLIIYEP